MKTINTVDRPKSILFFTVITVLFVAAVISYFFVIGWMTERHKTDLTDRPRVYWKPVDCIVTDIDQNLFGLELTVYSPDYNLSKKFVVSGNRLADYCDYKENDTISCIVYSQVEDGEVTNVSLSLYNLYQEAAGVSDVGS